MRTLRIAGVGALLIGLAACGGGLGPDLDFDIPDVPEIEPGPALRTKPNVVVADGGKATCVWVGDGHVHAERFIPGHGWTDYERIDDGAPTADDPQVSTSPDGDAVVVWTQDGEVVANCFEVGSGWQGPEVVSTPGGAPAREPRIGTDDDGETVVVWEEDGDIVSRCFEPTTGWTPPVPVSTPAAPASRPDIDVPDRGDPVAVWTEPVADGPDEVVVSTFDTATDTWSPPVVVGTGTAPKVAADPSGGGIVVFVDAGEVKAARTDPQGAWQPPVTVDVPDVVAPARDPDVAMAPGGDAMVVFVNGTESYASRHETGVGFEVPVPLAPSVDVVGDPHVALDDEGNAIAIFEDTRGHVRSTVYREAYDVWLPVADRGAGHEPVVDVNDHGEAIGVWVIGDAIGATRIRDLDPTVARTLTVTIEGQGSVGALDGALACDAGLGVCTQPLPEGAEIVLQPTPAVGWTFSHWRETGTTEPLLPLEITGDVGVTAVFVPLP